MRRPAGYQPELVLIIPWTGGQTPEVITAMALNSAYGVLAVATFTGVSIVDIVSYTQIYTWATSEILNREPIPLSIPPQTSEASPSEVSLLHCLSLPITPLTDLKDRCSNYAVWLLL